MKPIILTLGSILWTILFYEQEIGLNVFLFTIMVLAFWFFSDRKYLKDKTNIVFAVGLLVSGFFVLCYGAAFPMIMFVFSLFYLSTARYPEKISLITRPAYLFLGTAYISFTAWIKRVNTPIEKPVQEPNESDSRKVVNNIKYIYWIIFSCITIVLFFFLYQDSNKIFYELTRQIQIDISAGPIFFTLFGVVVLLHLFYTTVVESWSKFESALPDIHSNPEHADQGYLKSRNGILTVLLGVLNLLIFSTNLIDVLYLTGSIDPPTNLSHSEIVHDAIGSVIFSIIVAMILILIVYSGKQDLRLISKPLLVLTYVWIFQNLLLVLTAFEKNYEYVLMHDLTYKRIGVMVYLFLSVVGLFFVYRKIQGKKSNWFVFRRTAFTFYLVLLFLSTFNWPIIVTTYNLNSALEKGHISDLQYLLDLDDRNIYMLKDFSNEHPEFFDEYDIHVIDDRISELNERSTTWQSYTFSNSGFLQKSRL